MNAVIEFEHVFFAYPGTCAVLEDVTFSIREKDLAAMIGPNGGGKTTLLYLMLGLLHPTSGCVRVLGGDPSEVRPRIGYMPQYTEYDPQFPVDVMDVVAMGRLRRGWGWFTRKDREACRAALGELGIESLAKKPFSMLSGGQRQRVLIARALCGEPELLLLDEPTANVDPRAQDQFYEVLDLLKNRMAIVVVSHDLGLVSNRIERVICVNRVVHLHPVSELGGAVIDELYGSKMNLVRHDHCCSERERHHV
ncbi:MAG: ABC transporter ATP-binding protein [Kiritimatiellae bacterium]|nr:ABC transporter ATP-binding protein [Kiritimatiellia bacterium]